ncbi:MAG: lipopolysaccharide transport periplasmic protein LptA [Proteobacteria bacterium]|nr:lipopolysaccharide transport periplasmic protein LptA [Pseudomonadota bacterium]
MKRKSVSKLLLLFSFGLADGAYALSSDKEQPLNIDADTVEIDDKAGVSVYKGNVTATQGTLVLDADIVTIYSPQRELDKVIAEGNPARYKQRPDNKDEDVRAKAQRMEYYADKGKLILLEGGHLWQGQDEFSGNRIEYDTRRDVVNASMSSSGKERVRIVIQPRKKDPAAPAPVPGKP